MKLSPFFIEDTKLVRRVIEFESNIEGTFDNFLQINFLAYLLNLAL